MATKKAKREAEPKPCAAAMFDLGRVLQRVEVLLAEMRQRVRGGSEDQIVVAALNDAAIDEVSRAIDDIDSRVKLPAEVA